MTRFSNIPPIGFIPATAKPGQLGKGNSQRVMASSPGLVKILAPANTQIYGEVSTQSMGAAQQIMVANLLPKQIRRPPRTKVGPTI